MKRTPLFPAPSPKLSPEAYLRNYWCPHYDTCLDEAAALDHYLDCSQCLHKTIRTPDISFTASLP
jgi:hypothetical protein